MRHVWSSIGVVALALSAGTAMAQSTDESNAGAGGPGALSTACTHSFGSGDLVWCISDGGNLVQLTSPAGAEHVAIGGIQEGYAVCAASGTYIDIALSEAGWGAASVLKSGKNTITIRRVTADGNFQLDQKWTRDTKERDLTLQMTLTNLGAAQDVTLMRNIDIDADNTFTGDFWDQSAHAGWVRETNGITFSSLTLGVPHTVVIDNPSHIHSSCSPPAVASPGGPGDPGVSIIYALGTMATGSKKVVRVNYRVQ